MQECSLDLVFLLRRRFRIDESGPYDPRLHAIATLDGRFRRYKIVHDAADTPVAAEDQQAHRARVVACFNPANDTSASFLLRRPSLHPIYTPAGLPVTEQGAHNYPHHKGVFLTLGKIDNTNVYVDTTHNSGRLGARAVSSDKKS